MFAQPTPNVTGFRGPSYARERHLSYVSTGIIGKPVDP